MYTRNKMEEVTVNRVTRQPTTPYITSLFPPKIVNYDLRSNIPI